MARYQITRTLPVTEIVAEFDSEAEAAAFWDSDESTPLVDPQESGMFVDTQTGKVIDEYS